MSACASDGARRSSAPRLNLERAAAEDPTAAVEGSGQPNTSLFFSFMSGVLFFFFCLFVFVLLSFPLRLQRRSCFVVVVVVVGFMDEPRRPRRARRISLVAETCKKRERCSASLYKYPPHVHSYYRRGARRRCARIHGQTAKNDRERFSINPGNSVLVKREEVISQY